MASRVDLADVLVAINTVNADYQESPDCLDNITTLLTRIESSLADGFCEMRNGFDSIDRQLGEIKNLVIAKRAIR